MMEWVQTLMVAFGGSAAMLVVLGFLGKSLVVQLRAREAEQLRSRHKAEGDARLERLKAQLRQASQQDGPQ